MPTNGQKVMPTYGQERTMNELDEVFETSEDEATETTEVAETEEATQEVKEVESEDKVVANDEPTASEEAQTANEEPIKVPLAALQDEKHKRQGLESTVERLEREIASLKQPKIEETQEEDVDIFSDPEGFKNKVQQETQKAILQTKISMSQEIMRGTHDDYNEMEAKFIEMTKADPSLVAKMNQATLPAKFVYESAQKQIMFDEIGDPAAYKEKLKAEILKELKGEDPEPKEEEQKPVKTTPSLATVTAAGSNGEKTISENNLEEMFADSEL